MRELHDDEDVAEMYVLHKRRSDVLLWLYGNVESSPEVNDATLSRKRPRVDNPTQLLVNVNLLPDNQCSRDHC